MTWPWFCVCGDVQSWGRNRRCVCVWLYVWRFWLGTATSIQSIAYSITTCKSSDLMCRHGNHQHQHQMHCRTLVQHQSRSICSNSRLHAPCQALQVMPNAVNSPTYGEKIELTHSTAMMTRIGVSVRRGNAAMQDAMWPNRSSFSAGSMPS